MKTKKHSPRQIAGTFLRGKTPVQGETLKEVAGVLCARYKAGNETVAQVESRLFRAVNGGRLSKCLVGNISYYEPKKAKAKRERLTRNSAQSNKASEAALA